MRSGARRGWRERRQALVGAEGREAGGAGRQAGRRHRREENRRRKAALVLGGEVHGELGLCLWRGRLGRLTARHRREEAAAASGIGGPVLVHGGGGVGLSRSLGFRRSASRGGEGGDPGILPAARFCDGETSECERGGKRAKREGGGTGAVRCAQKERRVDENGKFAVCLWLHAPLGLGGLSFPALLAMAGRPERVTWASRSRELHGHFFF
jgi:hypothetical protein